MACLSLLLRAQPGEALQLVGTVVDMECCYLTAEVFRTILLAGSPAAAGTAQVQAQLHRLGHASTVVTLNTCCGATTLRARRFRSQLLFFTIPR